MKITKTKLVIVGRCNNCRTGIDKDGTMDQDVYEIELDRLTFRLCENCLFELYTKLRIDRTELLDF